MQPRPAFHVSDAEGREFAVEEFAKNPERLTAKDIAYVRDYYRARARERHAPEVKRRLEDIVRRIFIALREEKRHVYIDEIDKPSLPIQTSADVDAIAEYLTDVRNLRGIHASLAHELARYGRPFLLLPSHDRLELWLELA